MEDQPREDLQPGSEATEADLADWVVVNPPAGGAVVDEPPVGAGLPGPSWAEWDEVVEPVPGQLVQVASQVQLDGLLEAWVLADPLLLQPMVPGLVLDRPAVSGAWVVVSGPVVLEVISAGQVRLTGGAEAGQVAGGSVELEEGTGVEQVTGGQVVMLGAARIGKVIDGQAVVVAGGQVGLATGGRLFVEGGQVTVAGTARVTATGGLIRIQANPADPVRPVVWLPEGSTAEVEPADWPVERPQGPLTQLPADVLAMQILPRLPADDQVQLGRTSHAFREQVGEVPAPLTRDDFGYEHPVLNIAHQETLDALLDDAEREGPLHFWPAPGSALSIDRRTANRRNVYLHGPEPLATVTGKAYLHAVEDAVITAVTGGEVIAHDNAQILSMTGGEVYAKGSNRITTSGGSVYPQGPARIHASGDARIEGFDGDPFHPLAIITGPDGGPVPDTVKVGERYLLHTPTTQDELEAMLDNPVDDEEFHLRLAPDSALRISRLPANGAFILLYGPGSVAEISGDTIVGTSDAVITLVSGGTVGVMDTARVTAVIGGQVQARGHTQVTGVTGGEVIASEDAQIIASGGRIEASHDAQITASGGEVIAQGRVRIRASGNVTITGPDGGPVPATVQITGPGGRGDPVPDTVQIRR